MPQRYCTDSNRIVLGDKDQRVFVVVCAPGAKFGIYDGRWPATKDAERERLTGITEWTISRRRAAELSASQSHVDTQRSHCVIGHHRCPATTTQSPLTTDHSLTMHWPPVSSRPADSTRRHTVSGDAIHYAHLLSCRHQLAV